MKKLLPLFFLVTTLMAGGAFARSPMFGIERAAESVVDNYKSETMPATGTVEVAFSPYGGGRATLMRFIGEAKSSILMAAYGLTSNDIGQALVAARKRGVDVRVVVDKDHNGRQKSPNSVVAFLAANDIPVRVDTAVKIQHNKFIVVDQKSVEQGSYNFTQAAEKDNAENIMISRDNPKLAALFTKAWQKLWAQSTDFRRTY